MVRTQPNSWYSRNWPAVLVVAIYGIILGCALMGALLSEPLPTGDLTGPQTVTLTSYAHHSFPRWMREPCSTEDSYNCYRDANADGNGRGHSFYAIPINRAFVVVVYWDDSYNRRHSHVALQPGWRWVRGGLADALREGDAPDADTRVWERCAVRFGPTTKINCLDGWWETS